MQKLSNDYLGFYSWCTLWEFHSNFFIPLMASTQVYSLKKKKNQPFSFLSSLFQLIIYTIALAIVGYTCSLFFFNLKSWFALSLLSFEILNNKETRAYCYLGYKKKYLQKKDYMVYKII